MPFNDVGHLWNYDSTNMCVYQSLFSRLVITVISFRQFVKKRSSKLFPLLVMIEYCPIPLPCSVSGIMQWPVTLIPYPVPTYGCNKDTLVFLWRRVQALFWTNMLLYKALWRRHSFKVLFKHKALEWLMHVAPIIVTTWGKELCHFWKRSKRSTMRHEITPCAEFQPL